MSLSKGTLKIYNNSLHTLSKNLFNNITITPLLLNNKKNQKTILYYLKNKPLNTQNIALKAIYNLTNQYDDLDESIKKIFNKTFKNISTKLQKNKKYDTVTINELDTIKNKFEHLISPDKFIYKYDIRYMLFLLYSIKELSIIKSEYLYNTYVINTITDISQTNKKYNNYITIDTNTLIINKKNKPQCIINIPPEIINIIKFYINKIYKNNNNIHWLFPTNTLDKHISQSYFSNIFSRTIKTYINKTVCANSIKKQYIISQLNNKQYTIENAKYDIAIMDVKLHL